MAGFRIVLFIAFTATTLITVTSRAVNISNTWVLPEEGFPVFYRYFRDRISWTEADAVCQFHHANLVTVDTTSQYDAVRAYLKELDIANNVWIGLSRTSDKRNFTWRDFRELSLTDYWQEAIPTGNDPLCAVMDPAADFRWHAFQCAGPSVAAFICELPVPTWATGPQGCLLTELPSLTVLFIPEQSAVELTSDCGLGGTKRIACKGNSDRDDMVKRLACDNTDVLDDKTLSPVTTMSNQDGAKTTKSWIWTSNTIDTGDYGLPTRHRRETEDTSPSSTNFKTESLVTESITVATTSEVETTASSSTSPENEEFPSAINQGQLFSIIENGSVFDVIELNGTEENKTVSVEGGSTTVVYHKEPTEDSTSMLTKVDDVARKKNKAGKFAESAKKVKTITKFIDAQLKKAQQLKSIKEDNTKATSIKEDNTKATSIKDDNTKATSIKEDNTKATSIKEDNTKVTSIEEDNKSFEESTKAFVNTKPIEDGGINLKHTTESPKDAGVRSSEEGGKVGGLNYKSSEEIAKESDGINYKSSEEVFKFPSLNPEEVTSNPKDDTTKLPEEHPAKTAEEAANAKTTIDDFITREANSHNPFYETDEKTTTTEFLNKEVDLYPIKTNPSQRLNRTDRKELPAKPDENIDIDVDNSIVQEREQHKTVEIVLDRENATKSTLFVTTRRAKNAVDGGGATKSPVTEESLAAEPTVKPNRQRQLTRPQRRSFYPYFFSRVLG